MNRTDHDAGADSPVRRVVSVLVLLAAVCITVATSPSEDSSNQEVHLQTVVFDTSSEIIEGEISLDHGLDERWERRTITFAVKADSPHPPLHLELLNSNRERLAQSTLDHGSATTSFRVWTSCQEEDCTLPVTYRVQSLQDAGELAVNPSIFVQFGRGADDGLDEVEATVTEATVLPLDPDVHTPEIRGTARLHIGPDDVVDGFWIAAPEADCKAADPLLTVLESTQRTGWSLTHVAHDNTATVEPPAPPIEFTPVSCAQGVTDAQGFWVILSGTTPAAASVEVGVVGDSSLGDIRIDDAIRTRVADTALVPNWASTIATEHVEPGDSGVSSRVYVVDVEGPTAPGLPSWMAVPSGTAAADGPCPQVRCDGISMIWEPRDPAEVIPEINVAVYRLDAVAP